MIERAWAAFGEAGSLPLPVDRLTTASEFQQPGKRAHGIAAVVIVAAGDGPLLTVGSLHAAGYSPPVLLACAKPVSRQAWRLKDVKPHLDRLILRGWHRAGDSRSLATDEPAGWITDLEALGDLPPERLILFAARHAPRPAGEADGFAAELEDPVRGETLSLSYSVQFLD